MSNGKWEAMSEKDFDAILENSINEVPPEDIVAEVTPWKKSMNRILVGIALSSITLNFWCLDYILPAIGIVLTLLGFRTLRRDNKWFGFCLIITVIRMSYFVPTLILNTTVIQSQIADSPVKSALTVANSVLLLVEYFCFWLGLRTVQKKANLTPRADGALALMIWYMLVCILAFAQYDGFIVPCAMIIGYIFIIRSICKLSKELDEAGYSIRTVSVKITDRCIVLTLTSILVIGCALGCIFGSSYPMEWSAVDVSEHKEVANIKTELIKLGFPEYVINDISSEDIAACDGALQVVVDVTDEKVNDGIIISDYENGNKEQNKAEDENTLRITGVGVKLPGERERWIIFHHFLWINASDFVGTESIQLWPAYKNVSQGWNSGGEVTGRVLYDENGKSFSSPYYSLGNQTFSSDSIFFGQQTSTDVFAAFSMPAKGNNYRGYLAYPVEENQDGYIIDSWVNYTHQKSLLQYPAMTAMEKRMTNSLNDAGAFITIQDALQFFPSDENSETLNQKTAEK